MYVYKSALTRIFISSFIHWEKKERERKKLFVVSKKNQKQQHVEKKEAVFVIRNCEHLRKSKIIERKRKTFVVCVYIHKDL